MTPLAAGLLVFSTSASVLVLEILAGRLLAPYVGVTLETFTGIIGVVLAGISLGSWVGGRVADEVPPRRLLGPLVAAGGVLSLAAPVAIDVLGPSVGGRSPGAIVVLAFAGFFAPAAVLSAVAPTVVKLQLSDLGETGSVVGRLSALGTAGAIAGTFVTGFLLVATIGSRLIVTVLGGALVLAGVGLWWRLRPDDRAGTAGTLVVALLAGLLGVAADGPCEYESPYFCARVEVDAERDGGRLLLLDTLRHSYVDLDDPTHLEFTYARTFGDVLATLAPPGEPLDALHIGGGGFTMPRYLAATRPGSRSVVLELDPTLVRIAREELGLETGPQLEVAVGDARLSIAEVASGSRDVVLGDAFGGLAVPWHLTTVEFLDEVERVLRPGGTYVMNLIDHPPLGFARAEARTLGAVFDHVVVLAPPERVAGDAGGNFVLVASDAPVDVDAILARGRERGDDEVALAGSDLRRFVDGAPVLTDDFAPVDQLLTTTG